MRDDDLFLVRQGLIDSDTLRAVRHEAAEIGRTPSEVLLARRRVTPDAYALALGRELGVPTGDPADHSALTITWIDATALSPTDVRAMVEQAWRLGRQPRLFAGLSYREDFRSSQARRKAVRGAINGLRLRFPHLSAGRSIWLWQYIVVGVLGGAMMGAAVFDPEQALRIVTIAVVLPFAVIVAQRIIILMAGMLGPEVAAQRPASLPDYMLPTYSVIVPLFREAEIFDDLIEALSRLNYPSAKLDVLLVVEADDEETAAAVSAKNLPDGFRTIAVLPSNPRTKPKALNYALGFARGDYVTVFDAEDMPHPNQLRIAAARFAAEDAAQCLQARLNIYNAGRSWWTAQFAIEYWTLYRCLLPALARLSIPIPLGGSSNHFSRRLLERANAWDPFNVTEDADLGMRLARMGASVEVLRSETREEAPSIWRQWLPQRTRWIKGWMQTYLVHSRQPLRLMRELGIWQWIGFHTLMGGFLLSALLHPLAYVAILSEWSSATSIVAISDSTADTLRRLAFLVLLAGYSVALAMLALGIWRSGRYRYFWCLVTAPLYWLCISFAAYRALIQLVFRPHLWEKTQHAARGHRGKGAPIRGGKR